MQRMIYKNQNSADRLSFYLLRMAFLASKAIF
jgi:hypothetical protein